MEKKMSNLEVADTKEATEQEQEQEKSETLTEEEKVIRKEVECLLEQVEEAEEEATQKGLTLKDNTEKPVEVVVEEIETKEEERKGLMRDDPEKVLEVVVEDIEETKEEVQKGLTRDDPEKLLEVVVEETEKTKQEERKGLMRDDPEKTPVVVVEETKQEERKGLTRDDPEKPPVVVVVEEEIEEVKEKERKNIMLQDDTEKPPVVVVVEEPFEEEAPDISWRKLLEDLHRKDETDQPTTREPDTRRRSPKLSWEVSDNLTLKHEVDRLMAVQEEDEEAEEENLGRSASEKPKKEKGPRTHGKKRPLMLTTGYFSRLYKTKSQIRKDTEEKKTGKAKESEPLDTENRFFRLSRQIMMDLREKEGKRDSEGTSSKRKGDRFARLAKMFTPDSVDKQKTAEFRKWLHTPRLSRPLKKIVLPSLDSKPKKEEDADLQPEREPQPKKCECDSFFSFAGVPSNVWSMGQRISHWRLAHSHGYHIDSFTQDKAYKHRLIRHEQDIKTAVPLPLQDLIEEEALIILMETLYDYQTKLGQYHPLAIELEDQVDKLNSDLQARGVLT